MAALPASFRPLSSITPLDVRSLHRVPLSTPPRTPSPSPYAQQLRRTGLVREASDDSEDVCDGGEEEEARVEEEEEGEWPLIVVTGGSGFIGSHTVLEILQEGK